MAGCPVDTEFIHSRFVQFQVKATEMPPAECANELVTRDGLLKAKIREALEAGAVYTLFNSRELNNTQKTARIEAIRGKLRELGEVFADTCRIEIYDASQIQTWTNKYIAAIVSVLNNVGRPLVNGLKSFEEWESLDRHNRLDYVSDETREAAAIELRSILTEGSKACRIIGASGLGKTRFALECCRPLDDESSNVVYLDAGRGIPNLAGLVSEWSRMDLDGLLVVDNCDLQLHKQLRQEIEQPQCRISLLTLHYSPDGDAETPPVQLNQMSSELIKQMLESVYGEQLKDLDRIASFAQGFPQMAVLLAEARLDQSGTVDMGSLTDNDLVERMLWAGVEPDENKKRILEACALFDIVGFLDELEVEAGFIAAEIANVELDELYRCIVEFEARGLINRAGRYVQIVPKPLAIRLAADWWRGTRDERQRELIDKDFPGHLQTSFCNQIEKLDFLPQVKELTADLCGSNAPFGQAEVILSDRGSRLFRSLVVVNPEATANSLLRVFDSLNQGKFSAIDGDTRRNLVWALERLCFHGGAFNSAVRCVYYLAKEENETWANNATGLFKQVFHTFLSGTEAPPNARLEFIDHLIQQGDEKDRNLAVSALAAAIDTHGTTRSVGAEHQGSGTPLEEWRPKIWQEAFDYWIAAIERLTQLSLSGLEEAKDAIAREIRGLMLSGEVVVEALDRSIRKIVDAQGPLWIKALDSIKDSIEYDSAGLPPKAVSMLNDWVQLLQPQELSERLLLFVTAANYEHRQGADDEFVDVAVQNAKQLAGELANVTRLTDDDLSTLLRGEQRQAYSFGSELWIQDAGRDELLERVVSLIATMEEPNIDLLLGMLNGQYSRSKERWKELIQRFTQAPLQTHYVRAVRTGEITDESLDVIYGLLIRNELPLLEVTLLKYGRVTQGISAESITQFALNVGQISNEADWIALSVLTMYCHGDSDKWQGCKDALRTISLRLNFDEDEKSVREGYDWKTAVSQVLDESDIKYSIALTKKIIEAVAENYDYSLVAHNITPILRRVFEIHGAQVWPLFSNAIESASSLEKFHLMQLLNKEGHGDERNVSLISSLPEDVIRGWCHERPDFAPTFVAGVTEPFENVENSWQLTERTRFLIDEFGNDEDVLRGLSSNMGSFSWRGSLVPFYKAQLDAMQTIQHHPNKIVRNWAAGQVEYLETQINRQKGRDEESKWGVF